MHWAAAVWLIDWLDIYVNKQLKQSGVANNSECMFLISF